MPLTDELRRQVLSANEAMAQEALRVIGVAYRTLDEPPADPNPDIVENDLTFLGLFGMIDPPRPEVPPAVATARRAGIRTIEFIQRGGEGFAFLRFDFDFGRGVFKKIVGQLVRVLDAGENDGDLAEFDAAVDGEMDFDFGPHLVEQL